MIDWLFRDRTTGRLVIAQFPNVALWIFLATVVLGFVLPADGGPATVVDAIGVGALAWWAVDEVVRGVNPWRRILGVAGCGFAIAGLIRLVG